MFIGRIAAKPAQLNTLPKALADAFAETLSYDLASVAADRCELKSVPGAFFMIQDVHTKVHEQTKPEAHAKFIDIQYIVKGAERFGMAHAQDLKPSEDMLAEKDLAFYPAPAHEFFVEAAAGDYLIFFPGEIHRPMGCIKAPADVRKVVVKVPVAAL
jgi:biofilm protein TabA